MRSFRDIFKILLVIQVCSVTWAQFYGHPDAETIDVGHRSSVASRDQYIIEAAIRRGMDGEAVAELLRTKQPVVKVKAEPNGVTKTTTYKLDPDGSISSKTITEVKSIKRYESDALPDSVDLEDILKSPSGTVTRTFTDKDGTKVTRTFVVSKPRTTTTVDNDNDNDDHDDWIRRQSPVWSGSPESSPSVYGTPVRTWFPEPEEPTTNNFHKTTKTYTGPNGEKRVVESWSSDPEITPHDHRFPSTKWSSQPEESKSTNFHQTTRTYTGPNGESHVESTWSSDPKITSNDPRFPSSNWPSFGFPDFSDPWQPTDTLGGPDEWTVQEANPDVETTTKHKFQSWTPKTWNYPDFSTFEITTTAKPPKVSMQPKVTTPLPSLDDFLKNQYSHTTATTKTGTTTARPRTNSITTTTTTKPITIKIEDLPVTHILLNGEPADESIVKMLPPHLKPKLDTGTVLKIENKHPIETETVVPKKQETIERRLTKTHVGPSKPTLVDLDPQMQEILRNAGISPDDISNIEGDTITKTRKEPDGRVITTTYKVRTSPSKPEVVSTPYHNKPLELPRPPPLTPSTHDTPYNSSPISEFLAQFGLTKSDILSKNGEYTRTIIDDDGHLLTATFVLSAPMNITPKKKPFK